MTLFRDIEGLFYEVPEQALKQYEVKKESLDEALREKPVVGVQIPRPRGNGSGKTSSMPGIVINQYFGSPPLQSEEQQECLPSDIELAHYGTTIDNPGDPKT